MTRNRQKRKRKHCEWIPEIPQTDNMQSMYPIRLFQTAVTTPFIPFIIKAGYQFKVNQKMGGGTWVYLGTFGFDAGKSNACKVTLSNRSAKAGQTVTADAVKIGGGMGNIARRISEKGLPII